MWAGVLFLLLVCGDVSRGAGPPRLVLVHSYEAGQICGQPQDDGLVAALAENGFLDGETIEIHRFYMDTYRRYNTAEEIRRRGDEALALVERLQPAVVVTLDDNAAATVMLSLAGGTIPVVFSGINEQPERYNTRAHFMDSRRHPGGNVTGVYEKLHLLRSLRVLHDILPSATKVVGIFDESPTGRAVAEQVRLEMLEEPDGPVALEIRTVQDFNQYQACLAAINEDPEVAAVYPVVALLRDEHNTVWSSPELIRFTIHQLRKPELAVNSNFSRLGYWGGATVDFFAMGRQAGRQVAAILQGVKAGDLPIEDGRKNALVFNLARSRQLGIEIPGDILGAAENLYTTLPGAGEVP